MISALALSVVLASSSASEPSPFVFMVEVGAAAHDGTTKPFYGTARLGAGLHFDWLRLGLQGRVLFGLPAFDVGAFITADVVRVQLSDQFSMALFTGLDGLARFQGATPGGLAMGQLGFRALGLCMLVAAGADWRFGGLTYFNAEVRAGVELVELISAVTAGN
ncbi:MAG: hypothetical protein ACO1OB_30150 [Archangium sp.]